MPSSTNSSRSARAAAAAAILRCCRGLWERGLIAGADGNVSVRLGPARILVTPTGGHKAELRATDLVEVSPDGARLAGRRHATSELGLHLALYRARPDCLAVVHAHPPVATAFATVGRPLDAAVLPELLLLAGTVPTVKYLRPGTPAVGAAVARVARSAAAPSACLLAHHGAVTWGTTLDQARLRMESVEHAARILWHARQLGRVRRLPRTEQVALGRRREEGS